MELKNKVVTCRKTHSCEWCGDRIEIGEMAYYRATVNAYDEFLDGWQHPECYKAMLRVPEVTGIFSFVFALGSHPRGGINEDEIIDERDA